VGLLVSIILFWNVTGSIWTTLDYQLLDYFFQQAVKSGYGTGASSQIVYLTITDAIYKDFNKNILDRAYLAKINHALAQLAAEAVAYDIIFARPSNTEADQKFKNSLNTLGNVYLPIGLTLSEQAVSFRWQGGKAFKRFKNEFLKNPNEKDLATPIYGKSAIMQLDEFSEAAFNTGHISALSDADGVYRHAVILVKVDSLYIPTLSLSLFLDYVEVPFEEIIVHWGKEIRIPASEESFLEQDVIIPIDKKGRTYIPFPQVWNHDFQQMTTHTFLKRLEDPEQKGNLAEFFEGKFVFIGDISSGTSDLGKTQLMDKSPLLSMHAALLNGFLNNTFYGKWSFGSALGVIFLFTLVMGLSACFRAAWILYSAGILILIGLIALTWVQFIHFTLFPIVSIGGSSLFVFFGIIVGLQIAVAKDRTFIRNAFSKYVPEKVVNQMLLHPELLKLGGEERVLTVLFADLAGFTSISEKMPPQDLVRYLNEYLTEMTDIILAEGGIIDKFEGDAIMAEFGAPISTPNHEDMAVMAALKMQRRLSELREIWHQKDLPELHCRIGINTGTMIVGNMGSNNAFDYTVIGDAVNLASRLESANKRYETFLMISESTHAKLTPGKFRTRLLDVIKVKGKSKAIKAYEVYGEISEPIEPQELSYYQTYHLAFEAYLERRFSESREQFLQASSLRSKDPASKQMLARIDELNSSELPPVWDGSVVLSSK